MEAKLKHLEIIQGVIGRFEASSFRLKEWAVVLVAALLTLLSESDRMASLPIVFAPVFLFWGLDGYFLWRERLMRAVYDHVRVMDDSEIDFSLDVAPYRTGWKRSWFGSTLSMTLVLFYGALISLVVLIAAIVRVGVVLF